MEATNNKEKEKNTIICNNLNEIQRKASEQNYFLKKINKRNKAKNNIFNKIVESLISYKIFPFLNIKEIKEISKVNVHFHNSFIRYYEDELKFIINKHNLHIEQNLINYNTNSFYKQKDDKGHYIKINLSKIEHICLFSSFNWTWLIKKKKFII